ncbi:hypothetical protein KI387_044367, partial [Taxus chinensis]
LGQKYARDTDRPVWRKEARIGRFGDICPRQFGTSEPKVHRGCENLKEPQSNQNVPHVR